MRFIRNPISVIRPRRHAGLFSGGFKQISSVVILLHGCTLQAGEGVRATVLDFLN